MILITLIVASVFGFAAGQIACHYFREGQSLFGWGVAVGWFGWQALYYLAMKRFFPREPST